MIFIKSILLISIFAGSTSLGVMISNTYKNRTEELRELKKGLTYLKAKLEYTYEPLRDALNEISGMLKDEVANIFKIATIKLGELSAKEAWEYSVDISETNLAKEDLKVIRDFGQILGATNLNGQLSKIELTIEFLNKQIEEAEKLERKNAKLYRTLGAVAGIGIVVILI